TVPTLVTPPLIQAHPYSVTSLAGQTTNLVVEVSGAVPLGFNWFRNMTNMLGDGGRISGSTSSNLVLSDLLGGDSGTYTAVITNLYGSVTSSPALLSVGDPVIFSQPVSRTN